MDGDGSGLTGSGASSGASVHETPSYAGITPDGSTKDSDGGYGMYVLYVLILLVVVSLLVSYLLGSGLLA